MPNSTIVSQEVLTPNGYLEALSSGYHLTNNNVTFSFLLTDTFGFTVQYAGKSSIALTDFFAQQEADGDVITPGSLSQSAFLSAIDTINDYSGLKIIQSNTGSNSDLILATMQNQTYKDKVTDGLGTYAHLTETHAIATINASADNLPGSVNDGAGHIKWTAVHEILHAVGLYHPHDTDGGTSKLNIELDLTRFTAMSYNQTNFSIHDYVYNRVSGYAVTPMALDIATLQRLYGASSNNYDNTRYSWIEAGQKLDTDGNLDGQVSVGRALYAIWDTGGYDTIDFSASLTGTLINLNGSGLTYSVPQHILDMRTSLASMEKWGTIGAAVKDEITNDHSYFGGYLSTQILGGIGAFVDGLGLGGFVIANGYYNQASSVERAIGSNEADVIIGNEFENALHGLDGDDLIYGGDRDDEIFGGIGDDEISGGRGADFLTGGGGNDDIWFDLERDHAYGDMGDDHFILDTMSTDRSKATLYGGAGVDTLYVSQDYIDEIGPSWIAQFVNTKEIGQIKLHNIDFLVVGDKYDAAAPVYDLDKLIKDYFTNVGAAIGLSPNSEGATEKATISDIDPNDRVVYKATLDFPSNFTITGYSGTFTYFTGSESLVMSTTHLADKVEVTLSLPPGFEYDLDNYNTASFMQQNSFQIDYEYTTSVITDNGIIQHVIPGTKYYTSFTGVKNVYDNGLTEISGPDIIYADRQLNNQWNSGQELHYTHDSIEPGTPVRYWLSNDTSGLLQIDAGTGVVTTRSNLFRDGKTVFATIVASDGFSEVTKDIEVRLDTTLETAPEFIGTYEMQEVLAVAGATAGTLDWVDGSYGEKWRFEVEVVGSTASSPLFKMDSNGYPVFMVARTPTISEIGVTHQVKITVTDDTGQSDTTFMNVTIDPLEGVMAGTSGDDYLTPATWSDRIWVINGGDGNDDLNTGYNSKRIAKTTLNGGDGDDKLSLNAAFTTGNGDDGADEISLSADNTTANGGSGNDTISSWAYDTLIFGNSGDDIISAYYDRATIDAGTGNDTVWSYATGAVINGDDGNDYIYSSGQATITGGAGADTIYTLNDTLIFNNVSDSYLNNVSLTGSAGPEGLWDTIFGVNDNTIIDLSGLGEVEWAGSSTSSTSMLATMIEGDSAGHAFFAIDANRDGGYDFGIELKNIQAMNAIHFNGLSDWII